MSTVWAVYCMVLPPSLMVFFSLGRETIFSGSLFLFAGAEHPWCRGQLRLTSEVKCDLLLALISFKVQTQQARLWALWAVVRDENSNDSRGTFEGEVGAQVLCHFRYEHSLKCPWKLFGVSLVIMSFLECTIPFEGQSEGGKVVSNGRKRLKGGGGRGLLEDYTSRI